MPVELDLAQFPRLKCPRCGLVALIDPELPADVRPSLACPNCRRHLLQPLGRPQSPRSAAQARRRYDQQVDGSSPVPSSTAVGLTIAAIFLLLIIAGFVWLLVTPHQHYWWAIR